MVTFKDKAGLDVYLPHPAHKAFVTQLKPILDKVLVLDFVSKKN
ncbi:MAG: Dabb family protein [Akkermansiaceae bacterium]